MKSAPKNRTPIAHGSQSTAVTLYTPEMWDPLPDQKLVNLNINSVVSRRNAKFVCFDIKNFYLGTPLDIFEYVWVRFNEIPQEFIDKYNITDDNGDGWTYF